jgi:hypothetical protein
MVVVLMALGAAALFGVSNVLMHTQARAAPAEHSLRPALLLHLARQRVWVGGIGMQMAGFGLQATALGLGSLTLVQALGPTGLLVALPLAAHVSHKQFRRADWAGAAATVGGLAAFLAVAAPSKGIAIRFSHGFVSGVASWELYALAASGLLGMLLMQSSFQAGDIEWSLPAMAVANPVASVLAGIVAFHERVSAPAGSLFTLPVSLAVALVGVVALARSPALVALYEAPSGG